jgi:transposase
MIPLIGQYQLFLYTEPADMRKAFDGLSGLVASGLGRDPLDGSLYIFLNKRKNRMKCLVWDRDGFWLFYKRLEKGTFQIPIHTSGQAGIGLSHEQLMLILQGIDLDSIKRRPRYSRLKSDANG